MCSLWEVEKLEELPAVDIRRSLFQRSQSQAPLGHLTLLQSPLGAVVVESEKQQRYTAAQQEQTDTDRQRTWTRKQADWQRQKELKLGHENYREQPALVKGITVSAGSHSALCSMLGLCHASGCGTGVGGVSVGLDLSDDAGQSHQEPYGCRDGTFRQHFLHQDTHCDVQFICGSEETTFTFPLNWSLSLTLTEGTGCEPTG